jgi:DNA-binding response OmpR family regulator
MARLNILIIDDDEAGHSALHHVLDAEGWHMTLAPLAREGLARLSSGGNWKLVIANVALLDLQGTLFQTLKELAQAEPTPGKPRLGVLFMVPELLAPEARPLLEAEHLPYVLKPFHLNDFLERVSDLLLESQAITDPIRQVKPTLTRADQRKTKDRRSRFDRRSTSSMFASRKEYFMSEEEIAEWEKQDEEERKKRAADDVGNKDLGSGKR